MPLFSCILLRNEGKTDQSSGVSEAILEMRSVRSNMLSNPLQQAYVWHLHDRLRELGERQEASQGQP